MTDTETETVFVPTGRPAARFIALVLGLTVLLGALWMTGMVAPRLDFPSGGASYNMVLHTGDAQIDIRNQGFFPARIGRVKAVDRWVEVTGQTPDSVRVARGKTARITVRYVVDCAGYDRARNTAAGATAPELDLRIRVEGSIGVGRSVTHVEEIPYVCEAPRVTR